MPKRPLVSVILPVFNAKDYLHEAVDSILKQTFKDFELILMDDGSTDGSSQIAEEFARLDSRVRLFGGTHQGLGYWLNFGLSVAKGELAARMDADDISLPQRLEKEVAFLEANPNILLVGAQAQAMVGTSLTEFKSAFPTSPASIRRALWTGSCFCHPAVLMRKQPVLRCGGYRPWTVPAEDRELWLRLAEMGDLANLGQVLLYYRYHPGSFTQKIDDARMLINLVVRVAARMRRQGRPDPLSVPVAIDASLLERLGISDVDAARAIIDATASRAVQQAHLSCDPSKARKMMNDLGRHWAAGKLPCKYKAQKHWVEGRCLLAEQRTTDAAFHILLACFREPPLSATLIGAAVRRVCRETRSAFGAPGQKP
ncbi:MAG: glycosyltransferase [Syntrophobacteraceae bacterium]